MLLEAFIVGIVVVVLVSTSTNVASQVLDPASSSNTLGAEDLSGSGWNIWFDDLAFWKHDISLDADKSDKVTGNGCKPPGGC